MHASVDVTPWFIDVRRTN